MKNLTRSISDLAPRSGSDALSIALASDHERQLIYRFRHEVYARELGQHSPNEAGALRDGLDAGNVYLVVTANDEIAGFISITLPSQPRFSVDKYVARTAFPFVFDDTVFEIRLLTVRKPHRGGEVAMLLMYAAFRWVQAHNGRRIVAIGRREVLDLYLKAGLKKMGRTLQSGAVTYELLSATVEEISQQARSYQGLLSRIEGKTRWQLGFPFRQPAPCFHGGAFFSAIGEDFRTLERRERIINADVLDAWFPPSPRAVTALRENLDWLLRTSPPTGCEGLISAIAEARGVQPDHVLPGSGSSDLIFRCFRQWLSSRSQVLILDPTYGEYAHVLERVIGCVVDRLPLARANEYDVDLERFRAALADHYDLIVLVNPNSPTGRLIPRPAMEALLREVPERTRVWVDETYIDYAGAEQSVERFAVQTENVVVCKSMSKVYALSGARAAYICAGSHQLEELRSITPPWVVSLPGQVAAVHALQDPEYYRRRYDETHQLRNDLARGLQALGWKVVPAVANFLLGHLPDDGPTSAQLVESSRQHGLFLRNASVMGENLGPRAVRIAVKDAPTNRRMLSILAR